MKQFLAAIVLLLTLQACGSSGPSFLNTDVTGADYGKELSLTDHTGKPRTLAEFRGKIVVVFFGYTRCPDVCPDDAVGDEDDPRQTGRGPKEDSGAVRHD